jgi:hypothetical protein
MATTYNWWWIVFKLARLPVPKENFVTKSSEPWMSQQGIPNFVAAQPMPAAAGDKRQ